MRALRSFAERSGAWASPALLAIALLVTALPAGAGVDINRASEADLDGIRGLGPATTRAILAEREKAPFKSWKDLLTRVKGIGPGSAAQLSAAGLTVNGQGYGSSATPKD